MKCVCMCVFINSVDLKQIKAVTVIEIEVDAPPTFDCKHIWSSFLQNVVKL